jgi:predicted short-subunit dehydrogenase-like oxidoreductase (DUF2520 family)
VTENGRLNVGIIGAGPVGAVLGLALAGAGHLVVGISAVSQENRERAEALLPEVPLMDVPEILQKADLVLLAIPDDELVPTVTGLAEAGLWHPGQIVAHTSPEHGYSALAPAAARGAIPIAIHPAMRFTGTSVDLIKLPDAYFAVSAPKIALPIAQALVIEMGGEPVVVEEEARAKYAEAYSVASSFSALIVNQAIGLLEEAGIENPRGLLAPVVRTSVEQALAEGHQPLDPEAL